MACRTKMDSCRTRRKMKLNFAGIPDKIPINFAKLNTAVKTYKTIVKISDGCSTIRYNITISEKLIHRQEYVHKI